MYYNENIYSISVSNFRRKTEWKFSLLLSWTKTDSGAPVIAYNGVVLKLAVLKARQRP